MGAGGGDWTCGACQALVFASKNACFLCGTARGAGGRGRGGKRGAESWGGDANKCARGGHGERVVAGPCQGSKNTWMVGSKRPVAEVGTCCSCSAAVGLLRGFLDQGACCLATRGRGGGTSYTLMFRCVCFVRCLVSSRGNSTFLKHGCCGVSRSKTDAARARVGVPAMLRARKQALSSAEEEKRSKREARWSKQA